MKNHAKWVPYPRYKGIILGVLTFGASNRLCVVVVVVVAVEAVEKWMQILRVTTTKHIIIIILKDNFIIKQ